MTNIKATAIFYSKNSNLLLANKVKTIFDGFKIYTKYLNEIDDVILKKFSQVNFLVLDYTSNNLDERSIELLLKLKQEGYIKNIIIVSKNGDENNTYADLITAINNLEKALSSFVNSVKDSNTLKVYSPSWVSTIGEYLMELGLSPKHCGYLMLVKAISFYLTKNLLIKNLNTTIYPYLENNFLTSKSNIEMSLRTVIKSAYKNNKLKGNFNSCPTIKEFLNFSITGVYKKIFLC